MPGRIFGQLLPSPQLARPSANKPSPAVSVAEVRRPDMDHLKRPSLAMAMRRGVSGERSRSYEKKRSESKDKSRPTTAEPAPPRRPVRLGMVMESPPTLLIGQPAQSTGALISGRLQVTPTPQPGGSTGEVILEDIVMFLECTTSTRRPVQERCRECATTVVDLYEWKFLTKPKLFAAVDGMQELPFSHLVPGHLPATTHGQLGSIEYSLHVRARAADGTEIEFRRELPILRALMPGPEKNSVRIFPPTTLTLHVTLPSIVYPIGEFPVLCRMTGVTTRRADDTQTRWRLRKLSWRIEEHETAISAACPAHAARVGGEGRGISHEHARDIGGAELKAGWKTDFDGEGCIEGEFMAAVDATLAPAQCGVDAANGLKITHHLILELVIAEEWAPNRRATHPGTPTGAARVLRTQFVLRLTQRSGMGISWDDEQPPMYEDVPASPPHYQGGAVTRVENYDAEDLHEDVEHLTLSS